MKNWNDFPKLQDKNDLIDFFNSSAFLHGKYCHYTKVDIIEKILAGAFLCFCVSGFNDQCDKQQFGDKSNQKYFYSMCFSTGESENLALWYLYSGIDGRGARIRLTKPRMQELVEKSTYTLYRFSKRLKRKVGKGVPLIQGETMDRRVCDILYYQEEKGNMRLKYNTMVNNKIPCTEFYQYQKENNGFLKKSIWYYEKETRILIELKGKAKEFVKDEYCYVVEMEMPKTLLRWLNIELAPEIDDDLYKEILDKYPNIKKQANEIDKVRKSEHAGSVKMNFCKGCKKKCKIKLE